MNTATIFGSLADNETNFEPIVDLLKQRNITNVLVGGFYGQVKQFCEKATFQKSSLCKIKSLPR